jgi:undecaprenyl-diphosphatase
MRDIDIGVLHFLRSYFGRSPAFDGFVELLTENGLLKAGPILITLWVLWFVRDAQTDRRRVGIVSLLIAGCAAAAVSVYLTRILPLRLRPVFEPSLNLGMLQSTPEWARVSSLPSDHAALFVAMACGLMFVSRRWGWLALIDVVLFVCVPRAYVGLHYFWDLVAGASIGVIFALLCNTEFVRTRLSERLLRLEASHAPAFYGVMFTLTMEIADLFHDARQAVGLLVRALAWVGRSLGLPLN